MYNSLFTLIKVTIFDGTFPTEYAEEITTYIATTLAFFTALMPYLAVLLTAYLIIKAVFR